RVGRVAGDGGDEVDAVGAGLRLRGRLQRRLVGVAEGPRHRAGLADVPGEAAGVDARDAGHAVGAQVVVEAPGRPPARRAPSQLAHDDAPDEGAAALVVPVVGAVVADVRVGEGDDLPRVAGVGQHLLVAGEHRVEHDLAGG